MKNKNLRMISDPAEILKLSKEELVELYSITCQVSDDLESQKKAVKDLLADQIEGNGEVIGTFTVSKAKRLNFKVKLDQAKELGAIKLAVDTAVLKQLHKQGISIPHSVTEYVIIKEISK